MYIPDGAEAAARSSSSFMAAALATSLAIRAGSRPEAAARALRALPLPRTWIAFVGLLADGGVAVSAMVGCF